jgi:hypothetical protein
VAGSLSAAEAEGDFVRVRRLRIGVTDGSAPEDCDADFGKLRRFISPDRGAAIKFALWYRLPLVNYRSLLSIQRFLQGRLPDQNHQERIASFKSLPKKYKGDTVNNHIFAQNSLG